LVSERTRIINRMRSALARLGIRGFKPTLRKAPERLGECLPPRGQAPRAKALRSRRGRDRISCTSMSAVSMPTRCGVG
jgi:transposase